MPLVVLDPVVLVNTARVPDGASAKLLTLLAFGKSLAYLSEGFEAEQRLLEEQGGNLLSTAYDSEFARYHELVKSIPEGGRAIVSKLSLGLATSPALMDRVVRRVGHLRDVSSLGLDADLVARALSFHVAGWVRSDWDEVPDHTGKGCADSNITIHTALCGGHPLVVTKLTAAAPGSGNTTPYEPSDRRYPLGVAHAMRLDVMVSQLRREFAFDEVDASVLWRIAPRGP